MEIDKELLEQPISSKGKCLLEFVDLNRPMPLLETEFLPIPLSEVMTVSDFHFVTWGIFPHMHKKKKKNIFREILLEKNGQD